MVRKFASIVGARPQFIKYASIARALHGYSQTLPCGVCDILVHTGQHYDYLMSKVFFDELMIPQPGYNLEVGSGTQGWQTGQMLRGIEEVLLKDEPDCVLVYGDTNSTLAGALAASKLHIPVAHVEAGLRSYNRNMPEETNRVLTDHVSSFLFCPTEAAVKHLQKEGFSDIIENGKLTGTNPGFTFSGHGALDPVVLNVGDVMYDLFLHVIDIAERKSKILNKFHLSAKGYSLLTMHRAESTGNQKRFEEIVNFVNDTSAGQAVIFPMHPGTLKAYEKIGKKFADNIKIIEPVSYFDNLILLKNSALIMTDSGGIQKEAYWLKVPVVTLRDETEWEETIQSGWNILFKNYKGSHKPSDFKGIAYGDGKAAERIIAFLTKS